MSHFYYALSNHTQSNNFTQQNFFANVAKGGIWSLHFRGLLKNCLLGCSQDSEIKAK